MRGNLIVFSGLDGAGKSTQLDLLRQRLDATNIKHVTYWSRGGYTPGMERAKTMLRGLLGKRAVPDSGDAAARNREFSKPWKRRLWLRLAILDLWALYGVWFRVQRLLGRTVLADRYWQDTAIDFRLNFHDVDVESWWIWKCLVQLAPIPSRAFFLTIPIEESERRSAEKNEPFPTPREQLSARAAYYESLASEWHALNGMRDPNEIAEEVWHSVTNQTYVPGKSSRPPNSPTITLT